MDKINYEKNLMKWTFIIRGCLDSGMAVQAWCIENNVDEKKFYYWLFSLCGWNNIRMKYYQNHKLEKALPIAWIKKSIWKFFLKMAMFRLTTTQLKVALVASALGSITGIWLIRLMELKLAPLSTVLQKQQKRII